MTTEPVIETRFDQPYMGTRAVMAMSDFDRMVPAMTAKVSQWLDAIGLCPSGKPFLRYHVIDMPGRMDVELGIPLDGAPSAEGEVQKDVLPAGRYAVLSSKGVKNGVNANKKLIEWIASEGEQVWSHDAGKGEVFEARYETLRSDPTAQPDKDKWETEVAIKLRG